MSFIEFFASERLRRLSKEGLWVVAGQVASIAGALVGVRVLTEVLDPAAYGELALGLTVAALIGQTVLGPLGHGISRFYAPAVEGNDMGSYMWAALRMVKRASAIVVLLALISMLVLMLSGKSQWILLVLAAYFLALFAGYNSVLNGIQNAARQRSIVALHQGSLSWLRFLAAAAIAVALGATSTSAMLGYSLASGLVLGSQILFFRRMHARKEGGAGREYDWQKRIWQFTWPISTFGIFTWMYSISDKWALEAFSTTDDVGHYAVLYQLGYHPIALVSGMLMQLLGPIFYQRSGAATDVQRNAGVNTLSWRLTVVSLVVTGAGFVLALYTHTIIFGIFVAEEYRSTSYLLPWMILAGGLFASGQTLALNLMSQLKTRIQIIPKIVTALAGLALNICFAYLFGIGGVVAASVTFSVAFLCWYVILTLRCGNACTR